MNRKLKDHLFYFVLIAPALILLLGIVFWPFLNVFLVSMQNKNLLEATSQFIGLTNFIHVIKDPDFWQAFIVDIIFTGGAVGLGALVGLGVSLLLHQKLPFRGLARALVLFPYVVPTIVAALVWRYMFNDLYGVLTYLLSGIGIQSAAWLSKPDTALISVILVATWKYFPFFVIALLSRMQIIPLELYESAQIDGANAIQGFRYITWPSIVPIFLLTIILRVIWTFNKFDLIFLLTGGGPGNSTTTLPVLVYNEGFMNYNLGRAAAMAIIMFVFLGVMGLIYSFVSERMVEDVYA